MKGYMHNKGKKLVYYTTHSSYEYPYEVILNRFKVISLILTTVLGCLLTGYLFKSEPLLSPIPQRAYAITTKVTQFVEVPQENIDTWVGKYVDRYYTGSQASEMRAFMHKLINMETKHGYDKNCGDGGKACGLLQYHQPTWESFRKQMIKQGKTDVVGSRMNPEQAIHTTVWAMKNGYIRHWGCAMRYLKGSEMQVCEVPSFLK